MQSNQRGGSEMKECDRCLFRRLNCSGYEAAFVLEILIRIRPDIGSYCAVFDAARIRAYRQLREHHGTGTERPDECEKKSLK
jgi:hypothetical protein